MACARARTRKKGRDGMAPTAWIGTRKGLFRVRRESRGWSLHLAGFLGDPVSMVLPDSRQRHLHVALDHGHFGPKLHRSEDGGETFVERPMPSFPEKPEGVEDADAWGTPIPWSVKQVWELEEGGADRPGRLWLGSIPGALFRSDDGGDSWAIVRSLWDHEGRKRWFGGGADLPGLHSVCVDPRDSRRVTVAVSCGGVWRSDDDGESWRCHGEGMHASFLPPETAGDMGVQDPHRVVRCTASPDVLWCQHHDTAWRSTDDAATWTELTALQPSRFGFAVAAHPSDERTAWFVPAIKDEKRVPVDAKVVVARTRDGGESFEVLRQGLPQQDAYDLTYRHALDVDASGERLVFATTTGSAWVSEDGGDHWTLISSHLPPALVARWQR